MDGVSKQEFHSDAGPSEDMSRFTAASFPELFKSDDVFWFIRIIDQHYIC